MALQTSSVQQPDGSTTTYSWASLCQNDYSDFCAPLVYKIINPDASQVWQYWASNSTEEPNGVPSGVFVNPYVKYEAYVTSNASGAAASAKECLVDADGNRQIDT
jgi:hypothetical protein